MFGLGRNKQGGSVAPKKQPEVLSQMGFDTQEPAQPPRPKTILQEKEEELASTLVSLGKLEEEAKKLQMDIYYMKRHPEGVEILTRLMEEWKKKQTI